MLIVEEFFRIFFGKLLLDIFLSEEYLKFSFKTTGLHVHNVKGNLHPNHSLVGMDKLSWQRGNRSILINFDLENDSNQGGQIVEIDHDAKTAKIEAWSSNDSLSKEKITPKNPRLTQLDPSQKAKLEKAVQHRLTHPIRNS